MAQPLLYAAGVGAIVLTALILVRLLKIERTLCVLLALVVLCSAQVVLAVEALSLIHALSGPALLALHLAVALGLLAVGLRPAPPRAKERARALWSWFLALRPRAVPALALVTPAAGLVLLYLVLTVPPNNGDSMTYHLPRALTYLQQRSLDAYTTPDLRETVFPANSEILILWQLALWPAEATAGLVHLLAWAASGLAVFGLARQLGNPAAPSAFAGLAFMSFPAVVLQASTTQNDLLTACFLLCVLFFVAEACAAPRADVGALLLAGLAMGLAVGTKTTALFALPGFAPWVLAWLPGKRTDRTKRVLLVSASCGLGIVLLGAYFYVQNVRRFGHIGGPPAFRSIVALDGHEPATIWSNLGRLGFRLADPTGVAPPGRVSRNLARVHQAVSLRAFDALGVQLTIKARDLDHPYARWPTIPAVSISEDVTAFGPVLALLGLPVLALAGWRSRRHAALVCAALLYLLVVASLLRWQLWHGRILVTFAAFTAPLLPPFLVRSSRLGAVWSALVALACASCLVVCAAYNQRKALVGPDSIWRKDRIQHLRIGPPRDDTMFRLLDALSPPVSLVTVAPKHPGEARYPLFGARLDRRVRELRLDRETLPSPSGGGRTEALLLSGETAVHYIDGERPPDSTLPWTSLDLRPHLERLRRPGSGWRALADADGGGHLFVPEGQPLAFEPTLPDVLPLDDQWWSDGWVGPTVRMLVRFDPARPRLEISGAMLDHGGSSSVSASAPQGQALRTFSVAPGPFRVRIPLGPFRRERPADYVGVEIRCDRSFNPAARGLSVDTRDLAWRIERMSLVASRRGPDAGSAPSDVD